MPSSTPTFEPTDVPTATPTPITPDLSLLNSYFSGVAVENVKTDFPAWVNLVGNEQTGVNKTSVAGFKEYFLNRDLVLASGNGQIQKLDRMFGQLSLPVKDAQDRELNFDWRNAGQGLGFSSFDVKVLRNFDSMKAVQEGKGDGIFSSISRRGEDGYYRAWTISDAKDFEKTVLAYVDEYLRINGVTNPSTNSAVQGERRSLFEGIVYGDLGVKAPDDRDALWQTVNDEFNVCETHTTDATTRSQQPENLRDVHFDSNQEVLNNGIEEETPNLHDSRDTVIVVMLSDGGFLRVEVYDLGNPPDPLNPEMDALFGEKNPARDLGARWLPCGEGVPTVPGHEVPPPPRHEKGPNPGNGSDRGTGDTGNPGTGTNEH